MSLQFDGLLFIGCHEYWPHKCNFEIGMRSNHQLTKISVGRHRVEDFSLPLFHRPEVRSVCVGARLLDRMGTKSFAPGAVAPCFSILVWSDAGWIRVWHGTYMANYNHGVPALRVCPFVAATSDDLYVMKTGNLRIFPNVFGELMPMLYRLARRTTDLNFFPIVRKTEDRV